MYTFEDQYKTYIGTKFYHKSDPNQIYTFGEMTSNIHGNFANIDYTLDNLEQSVEYRIDDALRYIRDFIWIIVEDEPSDNQ